MAECIFIYGKSGAGKSRSLINFGADEIALINTIGKRLPFPTKFKVAKTTDNVDEIKALLGSIPTSIKAVVVDDAGYIMTNLFMNSHGKGDQFKMYNEIADSLWRLVNFVKYSMPEDVIVYFMFHEETNDFGESKIRTIGKLLDQKVCLEGLVTICLHAVVKNGDHIFVTNSNGNDICKSPEGLFDIEIPNDLKAVDARIREYWAI